MVLQRRSERLRRQEEAAGVATPSAAAAAPAPPVAPPPRQPEQQQPQQQQQPGAYAPPRYTPLNGSGANGYAPPAPAPPAASANGASSAAQLVPSPQSDSRSLRSGGREEAATPRKTTTVRFWLKFKAEWGQRLKVVGTHEELGEQQHREHRAQPTTRSLYPRVWPPGRAFGMLPGAEAAASRTGSLGGATGALPPGPLLSEHQLSLHAALSACRHVGAVPGTRAEVERGRQLAHHGGAARGWGSCLAS